MFRLESFDHRNAACGKLLEPVRRPGDDVAGDADDERRGRGHQARIRSEVERDLDPVAAWPHAESSRRGVRARDDDRNGQQVHERQRELLDRAIAMALAAIELERDVVATTERLQPRCLRVAGLQSIELIADEPDLLPQTADHARGALRRDLDHRRHHFEPAK